MKTKVILILFLLLLTGCAQSTLDDIKDETDEVIEEGESIIEEIVEDTEEETEESEETETEVEEDSDTYDWRTTELTDIRTGQTFTIAQFAGTPILLESFAVWCPICTSQQKNVAELHEELGDSVVSIALDTDPNEDSDTVHDHITENGFDWWYAISPTEMTTALTDEFGLTFVSAPSAPMVLICEDQSARFLDTGKKSAEELKAEIEAGC